MNELESAVHRREPPDLLDACRGREIWVVGDLMLDEYVHGAVERISPEAPVPVVRVGAVEYRSGGGANVARQVATLGAHAVLAGMVGEDEAGERLLADCARVGIDLRCVVADRSRPTTRKLRVLGHGQQLLRLDWENTEEYPNLQTDRMLADLESGIRPDAVIISDYAKGLLTAPILARLIAACRARGCPVLVDPKRRDLTPYRGANLLTPNLVELSTSAGVKLDAGDTSRIARAARQLIVELEVDSMLVTLGERGLLLVPARGASRHFPALRRAVADVTGAGDTVVGVLGALLGGGARLEEAAEIANVAAGLAVEQVGAVAIAPALIRSALSGLPGGKVLDRAALAARAAGWRVAGKRIVFTNGCFDLLHAGHLTLLLESARQGDVLVLAINSDESIRRLKGPARPIVPAAERAALLAALSCVDAITIFDEDTPLETLQVVRPHVLVKGQDYAIEDVVGRDLVEAQGGQVILVPLLADKSTSALVERIRQGARKSRAKIAIVPKGAR